MCAHAQMHAQHSTVYINLRTVQLLLLCRCQDDGMMALAGTGTSSTVIVTSAPEDRATTY